MARRSTTRSGTGRSENKVSKPKLKTSEKPRTKATPKTARGAKTKKASPKKTAVETKPVIQSESTTRMAGAEDVISKSTRSPQEKRDPVASTPKKHTTAEKMVLKQREGRMDYQTKWMDEMMNVARMSIEAGTKSVDAFQSHTQRNIEFAMKNASTLTEETKGMFDTWINNANKARKMYMEAVSEGMSTLEEQLNFHKK